MALHLSSELLQQLGACSAQHEMFKHLFGTATIRITQELCEKHARYFDFNWAAKKLLPPESHAAFEQVREAALKEYYMLPKSAKYVNTYDSEGRLTVVNVGRRVVNLKVANAFGRLAENYVTDGYVPRRG